ncbi:hypothetical protein [Nocardia otitidiscaviarum]|uniref:hypothetical protein n=1 Tax=Nocardia otitidiscaviarum TaxID=1823 RepID=UPI0004A6C885|nr:hypothetical protein [Nocardia otitidiscaviarum]
MLTNLDARDAIITAIEAGDASRDDFNIDAIVDDIYAATGDYNTEDVEPAEFWTIVERHAL